MAWTDVLDSEIATNDWISTGPVTKLVDNEQYNNDHGCRCGTDAVGVRLAIARGRTYFQCANISHPFYTASDDVGVAGNIDFATDSMDGNPNFSSTPMVWFTIEDFLEDGDNDTYWREDPIIIKQESEAGANKWYIVAYPPKFTKLTGRTKTGFSYQIWFNTSDRRQILGYVNWVAIGPVTTGE